MIRMILKENATARYLLFFGSQLLAGAGVCVCFLTIGQERLLAYVFTGQLFLMACVAFAGGYMGYRNTLNGYQRVMKKVTAHGGRLPTQLLIKYTAMASKEDCGAIGIRLALAQHVIDKITESAKNDAER